MKPQVFDSITVFLRTMGLPKPLHPLVTLVENPERVLFI